MTAHEQRLLELRLMRAQKDIKSLRAALDEARLEIDRMRALKDVFCLRHVQDCDPDGKCKWCDTEDACHVILRGYPEQLAGKLHTFMIRVEDKRDVCYREFVDGKVVYLRLTRSERNRFAHALLKEDD